MAHKSSVNFKLIHFLLWIKGSHQIPNIEAFVGSGESLPNFSCHFRNQILVIFETINQFFFNFCITPHRHET